MLKRQPVSSSIETQWDLENQDRVEFSTFGYRIVKQPVRLEVTDDGRARYSFRWSDCQLIESPDRERIYLHFPGKLITIRGQELYALMGHDSDHLAHPSLWDTLNSQSTIWISPSQGEEISKGRLHCISSIVVTDK
ncbi:MAG: hypothetical protein IT422_15820 [Pirellulaceae bacterium]|nr:hypothetical protein [Pirellulaceae bacterium]